MLGPGEKRAADVVDASNGNKKTMFKTNSYELFKKRWFVLDETNKTLKYYTNEKSRVEEGCIDMTTVIDIQACTDKDAPPYAIDLVGRGGRCSIAGITYPETIRWVYALDEVVKILRKIDIIGSPNLKNDNIRMQNSTDQDDDKRWYRYSYTFAEQGPLMINVVGLTDQDSYGNVQSHWLLVTSFARHPDGKLGAAEKSNLIKVKDYIVGVNDVDLTELPYNDAMSSMRAATFPKTVHFLRDLQNKQEAMFLECYVYAYYSAIYRRRRRYIELDSDSINFRKTSPEGTSASSKRDSFFPIDQISYLKPSIDQNFPDAKYLLSIICNPGSSIQLVGNDDLTVGSSPIDKLDLYFTEQREMDEWIKYLATSNLRPRRIGGYAIGDIHVAALETIQAGSKDSTKKKNVEILGIRSYVSGEFAPREFSITNDGYLLWQRPVQNQSLKDNTFAADKGRRMLLANNTTCLLRSIYAVEDPDSPEDYRYQLLIQDIGQMVWIGMKEQKTLKSWLAKIKKLVDTAPSMATQNLTIPEDILPLSAVLSALSDAQWEDENTGDVLSNPNGRRSSMSEDVGGNVQTRGGRAGSVFDFLTGRNSESFSSNGTTSTRSSFFGGGNGSNKEESPRSRAESMSNRSARAGSMFGLGK